MKKISYLVLSLFMISSCNSSEGTEAEESQNPAEEVASPASFSGVFTGTTPCADCPGIYTVTEFTADSNYYESLSYIERDNNFLDSGKWQLNDSVITVTFPGKNDQDRYFKITSDSTIRMLDADKNIITGDLEQYYILTKKDTSINK